MTRHPRRSLRNYSLKWFSISLLVSCRVNSSAQQLLVAIYIYGRVYTVLSIVFPSVSEPSSRGNSAASSGLEAQCTHFPMST
jgi:hypothetical protein